MPVVYISCDTCEGKGHKVINGVRHICLPCSGTGEVRVPVG